MKNEKLFIMGASARAAAEAAVGSGFNVIAADLFADRDLQCVAESIRVEDYPGDFLKVLKRFIRERPGWSVVYTGAIENHPDLIEEIETIAPLYGNSASVIRRVRDPLELYRVLKQHEISVVDVHASETANLHQDKRWLAKPLLSAGGQSVDFAAHQVSDTARTESKADDFYFQEFVEGTVCSGSYVFDQTSRPSSQLIGVTEMLVGCEWLGVDGFRYCGSITRIPDVRERQQWNHLGEVLSQQFQLRGLCGVDAILSNGDVVPIEVNPRFTASMELFDLQERSLLRRHVDAFHGASRMHKQLNTSLQCIGKCIVFAQEDVLFPDKWEHLEPPTVHFADIPQPQSISAGQPILTMIARAESRDQLMAVLRTESERLYDRLRK